MEFNTICELVDKASATYGRKLLYKTETSSIAYKELTPMVDNYAINLNDVKGEKIGILSENRFEWEITFFAILKSGNIVVPLDKNLTVDEIKEIVSSLKIKYVFTSNLYAKKLSRIENVMVFEDLNVMDNLNKTLNPVEIKPENEAVIAFTSGTTRTAKMVVLTHKNLCSNIHSVEQVYDLGTDDVCLSAMPLSHVLEGLFNMLNCINVGATRVHINGVENIIDALDNYKITYMGAVPAVLDYLLNYEEELSHVAKRINMFMCGGAKLSPDTVNGYAKLGIKVIQGYGLTECSPVVSLETDKHHRLGSVGKPLPGVTVEIEEKDEDGIGQIVITSDSTGTYKDIVYTIDGKVNGKDWTECKNMGGYEKEKGSPLPNSIKFNTEQEAENFWNSYNDLKLLDVICDLTVQQQNIQLDRLPFLDDYTHKITDVELYDMFGLTDKEIKYVENFETFREKRRKKK